jgi:hypothetical protein
MPTGWQSLPDNVYAISGGNPECFRRKFRRSAFLRIHNELAEVVRDVPDSGDSEAQARVGTAQDAYSSRRAVIGSTAAARRAGMSAATVPTSNNKSTTPEYVHASAGFT